MAELYAAIGSCNNALPRGDPASRGLGCERAVFIEVPERHHLRGLTPGTTHRRQLRARWGGMRSIVSAIAAATLLLGCSESPSSRADLPVAAITSHTDGERVLQGRVEVAGTAHARGAGAADLRTRWLLDTEVVCAEAAPTAAGAHHLHRRTHGV